MIRTPYDDVNRMLELIPARIHGILGDRLVGLYLSGSLVTGDFDLGVSDIDLVAVTATNLTLAEVDRLGTMHREIARQEKQWDNRIEVAYISTDALKTFRTRASTIGIVSPGESFHTVEAGKDWLINWYVAREKGIPVYGPPAATLIDPISDPEAVQWVREHLQGWREWIKQTRPRNAQVYAILTMCRALYTLRNGAFVSKRQAATWAAAELPEWAPVIQSALRSWREDWYNPAVDPQATRPDMERFVSFVIDQSS